MIAVEPTGRNTAPAIAWSTRVILGTDPDARIAVLPADAPDVAALIVAQPLATVLRKLTRPSSGM